MLWIARDRLVRARAYLGGSMLGIPHEMRALSEESTLRSVANHKRQRG
jgi:hypothetical protein